MGIELFEEAMGTSEQISRFIAKQADVNHGKPQRLGDTLVELMENQIAPRRARFGPVAEAWEQLLPAELRRHCRIADIQGGRLKVVAESPSYQFEMRLCSSQLVKELTMRCPRAKVERIEIVVG